ncbi:hypothetical protein [Rufibacter hautae]|uniref:hypothetical protein n=1 Tax=Rufibacter hautae TaxID=2595005 RepID=UPI001CC1E713|nr:hypothetical protein [Rufibacter hautae]
MLKNEGLDKLFINFDADLGSISLLLKQGYWAGAVQHSKRSALYLTIIDIDNIQYL